MQFADWSLSLLKTLPFIAVIIFELTPPTLVSKFVSVYDEIFISTKYELIHSDAMSELRNELLSKDGVTEQDLRSVLGTLQKDVGLDETELKDSMTDLIEYSDDWVRTKISLFATSISLLAVFSVI